MKRDKQIKCKGCGRLFYQFGNRVTCNVRCLHEWQKIQAKAYRERRKARELLDSKKEKTVDPMKCSCPIHDCPNRKDEGRFVGNICAPCYDFEAELDIWRNLYEA